MENNQNYKYTKYKENTGEIKCAALSLNLTIVLLSGGVLHSCGNGVCYVGDVNRLKKSAREQIQSGN